VLLAFPTSSTPSPGSPRGTAAPGGAPTGTKRAVIRRSSHTRMWRTVRLSSFVFRPTGEEQPHESSRLGIRRQAGHPRGRAARAKRAGLGPDQGARGGHLWVRDPRLSGHAPLSQAALDPGARGDRRHPRARPRRERRHRARILGRRPRLCRPAVDLRRVRLLHLWPPQPLPGQGGAGHHPLGRRAGRVHCRARLGALSPARPRLAR